MEAAFFRWNDDTRKIEDCQGYFIPGGFSYEDRGRSGMVAARDPLMGFLKEQANEGKVIIGNCNGAQILVESGLIPLGKGLQMSLARNVVGSVPVGFLSEWVWITSTCERKRCATSDWGECHGEPCRTMQLPIAHGEGRFTTRDKDLWEELRRNDQIAFSYCDADGNVSTHPMVTPNGSEFAVAGICNPEGNVVALMPHPERTPNGAPYFQSLKRWLGSQSHKVTKSQRHKIAEKNDHGKIPLCTPSHTELFIDTIITNNEERTVEQAARRIVPELRVKQLRYVPLKKESPAEFLSQLSRFNPHKEIAYVRRAGNLYRWISDVKREELMQEPRILTGVRLLRRDAPLEQRDYPGTCYVVSGIDEQKIYSTKLLEIFANANASSLFRLE